MKNILLTLILFISFAGFAQHNQVTQGENFAKHKIPVPGIPQKLQAIAGQKKMNVIFILTDDHRNDFMGFTGKIPWQKTPNSG